MKASQLSSSTREDHSKNVLTKTERILYGITYHEAI
jgi:hypothetical protein